MIGQPLMILRLIVSLFLLVITAAPHSEPASAAANDKRLLAMGWQVPLLQQMPRHLEAAQQTPLDGVIVDVGIHDRPLALAWLIFHTERLDTAQMEAIGANYANIDWGRLTDNFLRVNISPAQNIDWFDDFSSVIHNMRAAVQLARTLGFKGIMFDTEQYRDVILFNFQRQLYMNLHGYDAYVAQAYRRGRQLMAAINDIYPDITILYTFAHSFPAQRGSEFDGSRHSYGLMLPFLDGMLRAASEETTFVDGYENSYTFKRESDFRSAFLLMKERVPQGFTRHPQRYQRSFQAGFGLWLDHACPSGQGLIPGGCSGGFTPSTIKPIVDVALQYSDRYVWIYSQTVNWFTGEGIPADWQAPLQSLGR